ncbi:unnamed protein product [Polarella glacialis]|uniref:non-specific serine/threonine protein kinase n=2 Tax=Polarella glacialis TaxID=89957 RepID=A0A813I4G5_POLGL|nr:unnamed protein product [Polarella glacialis]
MQQEGFGMDGDLVCPHPLEGSRDESGDGTSGEEDGGATPRTPKRRGRKKLTITQTMGVSPSSALQIVINNPGVLDQVYKVDQAKPLGQGSFGIVRKAKVKSTGAVRAVKSISKQLMKEKMNILMKEIEIMKAVDHPNSIMLYEIFEDERNLYLVMELCAGGCLHQRVRSSGHLREADAAVAMRQIFRAVFYLHRSHICHRDLKAENILLSTSASLAKTLLKVSDFGLSCTFRPKQYLLQRVGTLTHMSPEVLEKKYNQSCDIWACGIILYFLLSSDVPFQDEAQILRGRVSYSSKAWWDASQDVVAFLGRLLVKAARRQSAEQALQDQWFEKCLPATVEPVLRFTLLDDLRTYRELNKFKRAALSTVASMLDEAHISESRDIFASLDTDGDGLLSVAELEERLRKISLDKAMHRAYGRREIERIFQDMDDVGAPLKDFSYTEFLAATFNRAECLTEAVCREVFNALDKTQDGIIDFKELVSGNMLGHIPVEELQQTLEELDQNGDSMIDFPEFMQMMRQ